MNTASFVSASTGNSPMVQIVKTSEVHRFNARVTGTPGQAITAVVGPLAGQNATDAGFPIGGYVTITGTADANGYVGTDGFPFYGPFTHYGVSVTTLTGSGATITSEIGG